MSKEEILEEKKELTYRRWAVRGFIKLRGVMLTLAAAHFVRENQNPLWEE